MDLRFEGKVVACHLPADLEINRDVVLVPYLLEELEVGGLPRLELAPFVLNEED